MKLKKIIFTLCLLSGLFLIKASEARIYIDIDSTSGKSLPIAIVPLKILDNSSDPEFDKFSNLLERDLKMSGLFEIIPRAAFLEPPSSGISRAETNFSLWKKTNADALVKGGVKKERDQYVLEIRLFDVHQQDVIIGKRYYFQIHNFEKAIHTFADQIIKKLTGQPGVFSSTKILCVGTLGTKKEIFELSPIGENLKQITRHRSIVLSPDWSREGRYIAYTSFATGNPDLFLFDRKKIKEKRISARKGLNLGASFAPHKNLIALAVSNDSDQEILILNYRGKIVKTLTQNWWIDIEPTWSPKGDALAFVSSQSGKPHIYRMNANGKNVKRLTWKGFHNVSPSWSPLGDKIAFSGKDRGRFDIFIMNPDGTQIERLTKGHGNNETPTWSPNGQMIAFSSDRSGKNQIYVMSRDGREQTQITDGVSQYSHPAWSPYLD